MNPRARSRIKITFSVLFEYIFNEENTSFRKDEIQISGYTIRTMMYAVYVCDMCVVEISNGDEVVMCSG